MDYIMPVAIPYFQQPDITDFSADIRWDEDSPLSITPARICDVHGMSALINQYASSNVMLARGPQYLYQHIQDYMVITAPDLNTGKNIVIACGALHVIWEDLAEIRSMAVHKACQKKGLGAKLVEALIKRCSFLGIPRVFVFTLVDKFFQNCGFEECNRNDLPPFVWVECSKCPKFYRCDEIAMMKYI